VSINGNIVSFFYQAGGISAMTFHPDGRTIFCGLDSTLKVRTENFIICCVIYFCKLLSCQFVVNRFTLGSQLGAMMWWI
jgi:hypothetical protein